VSEYLQTRRPPWRLAVEMKPASPRHADWLEDDATICAVPDDAFVRELMRREHPLVNCLAHFEHLGLTTVRVNDEGVGRLAADHLMERGFERFAFYAAGDDSEAPRRRLESFRDRLRERDLSVTNLSPFVSKPVPWHRLGASLREVGLPVGLFCAHDTLGRMAAGWLAAGDVAVPDEVGIIGVDNDELQCEIATPPLSSVDLPHEELGWEAAAVLHQLLDGGEPPRVTTLEPLGVVARQSSDVVAVDDPLLARTVRHMRQHACDPCTVAQVAESMGVSRRWLELRFREHFDRTPYEEIARIRMERAKYLLRSSRLPMRLIGPQCGFSLVHNFGRAFKQATGQTPGEYRREHTRRPGLSDA
jgi:LacI family transcriptional regulator